MTSQVLNCRVSRESVSLSHIGNGGREINKGNQDVWIPATSGFTRITCLYNPGRGCGGGFHVPAGPELGVHRYLVKHCSGSSCEGAFGRNQRINMRPGNVTSLQIHNQEKEYSCPMVSLSIETDTSMGRQSAGRGAAWLAGTAPWRSPPELAGLFLDSRLLSLQGCVLAAGAEIQG